MLVLPYMKSRFTKEVTKEVHSDKKFQKNLKSLVPISPVFEP